MTLCYKCCIITIIKNIIKGFMFQSLITGRIFLTNYFPMYETKKEFKNKTLEKELLEANLEIASLKKQSEEHKKNLLEARQKNCLS